MQLMTKMPAKDIPRTVHQNGFTLLEVLIALLVLAIGLLGLAALQTTGLRSNTMATQRTHATQLTYDISDRMRANMAAIYVTDAHNVVQSIIDNYDLDTCTKPPSPTNVTARNDLNTWCTDITSILPSGDAKIKQAIQVGLDGNNFATYDVTVYWDEARTNSKTTNCPPVNKDDRRCIQLNVTIPRPVPNA
jgi:type IV pilus assembly protein PilV